MTVGGSVLGHAVKRREDRALLTGAGSFTGDLHLDMPLTPDKLWEAINATR